jgi:hypothetical protein
MATSCADLAPLSPAENPFLFFPDEKPAERLYKVYNDGSHYIATLYIKGSGNPVPPGKRWRGDSAKDIAFDSLYFNALADGLRDGAMREYIKAGILRLFPDEPELDAYIEKRTERKLNNLYKRKKRFRRKANLNPWNYFVTITYNDILHSEGSFRAKLRKCLSNLHTRRGWRYMGVFERAPETGRLHFHGIVYVPDNEMIGTLTEQRDYDTRNHRMQTTYSNSFFAENYGRNDFKELDMLDLRNGDSLNYLLKYIGKSDGRVVYSRGVPAEIMKRLGDSDIVTDMQDFVTKYILFDDVVDWERDVGRNRRRQGSIMDLLCNPPS